jgi:sodium/potassium-transporting ATPase subunit alpha
VVGDIVRIELGRKIPADMRVIESMGLKVDNSSLTGENSLLNRTPECTSDNYFETQNMVFFTTLVREGWGRGVVVATGSNTFMGSVVELAP